MTTIRDAIRHVTQDNKVTREEWDANLKPLVDALPLEASEEARELVQLYTSDAFELDAGAQNELRKAVRARGYDAPTSRPAGIDNAAYAEAVIASNVSETDQVFKGLQERAGLAGAEITVGVADTGLDVQHDALQPKLFVNEGEIADDGIDNDGNGYVDDRNGFDFNTGKGLKGDSHTVNPEMPEGWIDDPDLPRTLLKDTDGHGTHVSGIITKGTDSVKVMGLTLIAGANFSGKLAAEAFDYAEAQGAKVINMSFRVNNRQDVADMLEAMAKHPDILFVASAGNDGRDINSYISESYLKKNTLPNFVVVSSADQDASKASYSNYGKPWSTHADIGSNVLSTTPGDKFTAMSGTSMASPNVGAAAAKARLMDPGLTAAQVKDLLALTTPAASEWDPLVNAGGLVDHEAAYTVAALTGLVRREGLTLEAAAAQLELSPETFESLRAVAEQFAPVAEPEPLEPFAEAACD